MSKLRIALLFGGKSVEHEISIRSAQNIYQYINRELFEVIPVGITGSGEWYITEDVTPQIQNGQSLEISLSGKNRGFSTSNGPVRVDMVFPALHGTDGEDGSIQGLLTALEIPFVGSGVLGSSICMSKLYTKKLLDAAGIPVSRYVAFSNTDTIDFDQVQNAIGLPFMVKAANLGSSVGVFKISAREGFQEIIDEVFQYDHTLLCEEFVSGRELECAVMGNLDAQASVPGEIVISDNYEFYTYEAKYEDPDAVQIVIPANLTKDQVREIQKLSVLSFNTLNCQDYARVDLFLSDDGRVLINEINTIPGFTNASMFPMMWNQHGINFPNLITKLINLALERYQKLAHIINARNA